MAAENSKKKLGDRLVEAGVITSAQLSLALVEQKRQGKLLGEVLEHLGFVSQEAISRALADETQSEYITLKSFIIDPDVIRLVPVDFALQHEAMPLKREGDNLTVAMSNTFDVPTIDELERMTNCRIEVVAAAPQEIIETIETEYVHAETIDELVNKALAAIADNEASEVGKQAPLILLVDRIIIQAVRRKATDIHIEAEENFVMIRFRIDGHLHQEALLPKTILLAIIARIKILSDLDVTEHRLPQDGRITTQIAGTKINLRVSILPTQFGESIVIRVLDTSGKAVNLDEVGLSTNDLQLFKKAISSSHGIVLVTGPTGSGKTTTLYAALHNIDSAKYSVFTLEDPIEYSISMIRQVQIQAEIGLTFAAGLRSLLRQDPDIMLVGEIRDEETAELAIRAAMTGHLVLSTLHTNTAVGAIPRLINMGVEPYLLASSLKLVVAQRLVRIICPNCKERDPDTSTLLKSITTDISPETPFYRGSPDGCHMCHKGYRGRMAIFEVFHMTNELKEALVPGVKESDIFDIAQKSGMKTMVADGIEKAKAGLISLSDILRVSE